jgi:hypothetical protein
MNARDRRCLPLVILSFSSSVVRWNALLPAVKWRPPSSPEAPFLERVARSKGKKHHPSSSIPCTNTSESGSGLYQTPGRPPKLSLFQSSLYQPPHP